MEAQRQDEIGILTWMNRAWRRHLYARGIGVFLCGAILVALSFLERNLYESRVKLIYIHKDDLSLSKLATGTPGAMALRSLGLGELGGGVLLPDILQSRSLLSKVMRDSVEFQGRRQSIFEIYKNDDKEAPGAFERVLDAFRSTYSRASYDNRNDMVSLRVLAPSPVLSAYIANEMTGLLNEHLVKNSTEHASQQRTFIEGRLKTVSEELRQAELALKNFREENRAIQSSPTLRMEESRLIRKVSLNEQVVSTLTAQYELARIEAVKNLPVIDVIDAAVPPYKKALPHRSLRLITGFLLALMGIGFWDAFRFWRATQPSVNDSEQ